MQKFVYFPIVWPVICFLWCWGGQCFLQARRYILPAFASGYAYLMNRKQKKLALVFVWLAVVLSMGYGENSVIRKWLGGSETLTRLLMSCLVSSPFVLYCLLAKQPAWLVTTIFMVNIAAWQVRAGSLGKIGRYDIIIEDICRSTACAVSLCLCA